MKMRPASLYIISFACFLAALILLGGCTISTPKGKLTVTTTPEANTQPATQPSTSAEAAQIASEKGAGGNEPATGTTMAKEQQLALEHGTAPANSSR